MENIAKLKTLLSVPKDILITSHRNPDGDAIGSSLATYLYLNKLGHTVKVIFPSEYPGFVAWMPDADKIIIYDIEPEKSEEIARRADIIFCLDFNSLERIDKLGEVIAG
ncbi:MAG: phosphoesterase RecJ-like protein, partial [Saprospiraceae bacterium]